MLQATVDSEAYPTTVVAEAAELDKWVCNLVRHSQWSCIPQLLCSTNFQVPP